RDAPEVVAVHRLLIVKAGKQKLEQVLADRGDGALRRQVRAVDVVDAADVAIGGEDVFGDFAQAGFHWKNVETGMSKVERRRSRANRSCGAAGFSSVRRWWSKARVRRPRSQPQLQLILPIHRPRFDAAPAQIGGEFRGETVDGEDAPRLHEFDVAQQIVVV